MRGTVAKRVRRVARWLVNNESANGLSYAEMVKEIKKMYKAGKLPVKG